MLDLLKNDIIQLRALEPEDLEVLYKWENDTDVWKYGSAISPYSKYILRQYIADAETDIFESKQLRFMITLENENKTLGTIDLFNFDPLNSRCGVGIYIDAKYRKNKFAEQALALLQNYAFNFLQINQLYAHIPESNTASLKLFKNSGFLEAGVLQEWIFSNNQYENVIIVQKLTTN